MSPMVKHLFLWIILLFAQFVIVMFYFEPSEIYKSIEKEQSITVNILGDTTEGVIRSSADKKFEAHIIDNNLVEKSHSFFSRKTKIGETMSDSIEVFWSSIYQVYQRFMLILYWFKYLFILVIPAIIHGFVKRRIMLYEAGWSSPVRYHASLHALVAMIGIPLIYLTFPFAVNTLIVPIWMALTAISITSFVSNIQKRI